MDIASILAAARPVLPVLVIPRLEQAVPLARALAKGGARVLEVTLRTDDALAALQAITAELPELIVGAGSVVAPEQVEQVRQAGAHFIVSPGFSIDVVKAAGECELPLLPGVITPSEVMAAHAAGFRYLKFFPAELAGGVEFLKALAGPFGDIRFCPTGGVSADNVTRYLALENVVCVGGSWIAPGELIEQADWLQIETLTRRLFE